MRYMVSDNVSNYKQRNKLSLRECAKKLHVNYGIISEFVNKKRCTARIDSICKIANAMGVEIDDLVFKNIYES